MRCFVAIELPERIRQQLAGLQQKVAEIGPAVRWVRPEGIHITLKFLGEVPEGVVPQVCEAAARVARQFPAFHLQVQGTGCFPSSGSPRVIWAGLGDLPEGLVDAQRQCEEECAALGYPPEKRAFHPHLTLARVKEGASSRGVREIIRRHENFSGGEFTASELIVFQSLLSPHGAKYIPISRAAFSKMS